MVTMAQTKRCKLAQHSHSSGLHAFTHTYNVTSTQFTLLQPCCAKHQLSNYIIFNQIFILKVSEGGGAIRSTQEKNPDSLPAKWYHILEEKIQCTGRE